MNLCNTKHNFPEKLFKNLISIFQIIFHKLNLKLFSRGNVKISRNECSEHFLQNYSCLCKRKYNIQNWHFELSKIKKELVKSPLPCFKMQKHSKFLYSSIHSKL